MYSKKGISFYNEYKSLLNIENIKYLQVLNVILPNIIITLYVYCTNKTRYSRYDCLIRLTELYVHCNQSLTKRTGVIRKDSCLYTFEKKKYKAFVKRR